MKIYIVDTAKGKFSHILADVWRKAGHEVKTFHCFHKPFYDWADVVYFDFADNNVKWYSNNIEKDKNKRVVVRCVDIDAYAGHLGGIDWSRVDSLVFISNHIREFSKKFRIPESVIVRCGVETDKFSISPIEHEGINIGWVGRLWIGKNVVGAMDIVYDVRKKSSVPVTLHIRGDNPNPNWWEELVKHKKKTLGINIVEYDYIDDLNEWYNKMDYVLVTSFKEAFSYVAGEAALCGVRPLVYDTPEMRETWGDWCYKTNSEAVDTILSASYDKKTVRDFVVNNYSAKEHIRRMSEICQIKI